MTDDSILSYLKKFGVTEVKQFTFKKGDTFVKALTFMLTFDTPDLPTKIDIGYERVLVRPYSKSTQVYGMSEIWSYKINCRRNSACTRCGCNENECKNVLKCINCDGEHAAFSKTCLVWTRENPGDQDSPK